MAQGIEEVHVAKIEQEGLQKGEKQIQSPDAFHGVHDAGVQFVIVDAIDFGHEELHAAHAQEGQDGDGEHDDGQTSNPLRHAAPKQDVFWHRLDVGEDGGTRGGEARQSLEEAIGEVGHALAEQVGHGTEKGDDQPRDANDVYTIALTGFVVAMLAGGDEQNETC